MFAIGCDDGSMDMPVSGDASSTTDTRSPVQANGACTFTYNKNGYSDPCVKAGVGYCTVDDLAYNVLNPGRAYLGIPDGQQYTGVCRTDCQLPETSASIPLDEACPVLNGNSHGTCLLRVMTDPASSTRNLMPACYGQPYLTYECQDGSKYLEIGSTCSNGSTCQLVEGTPACK